MAALGAFLGGVDLPGAAVVVGEPGVGKTTVLGACKARAASLGYRILLASPSRAETQFVFSSLRDVLDDVFDDVAPGLPAPQRWALGIALLKERPEAHAVPGAMVATAVLTALRLACRTQRILIVIDDSQWLDASSAEALTFALRRLDTEPVAVLLARRAGHSPGPLEDVLPRTEQVTVGPLTLGALQLLLQTRLGQALPRSLMRRIHEASGGNPFYALEIARVIQQRGDPPQPGEPLLLPHDLGNIVRARTSGLSASARAILPAVVAMFRPTVGVLQRVFGDDPAWAAGVGECVDAGVLSVVEDRVIVAHPLIAADVYESLSPPQRRDLHARLADALEDGTEEHARHRALAAAGPDLAVAAALDRAARQAFARGAPGAAGELAEAARRLTPPDHRTLANGRSIMAARYHFEAGDTGRAVHLLERVVHTCPPGRQRSAALSSLARVQLFTDDLGQAESLFRRAVEEGPHGHASDAETHEGLAWSLVLSRRAVAEASEHAAEAVVTARAARDVARTAEALAIQGVADLLLSRPGGQQGLDEALSMVGVHRYPRTMRHPLWASAVRRVFTDDLVAARDELLGLRHEATDNGDESSVARLELALSHVYVVTGEWAAARRSAVAGRAAALHSAQQPQAGMLLWSADMVDAHMGKLQTAARMASDALQGGSSDRGVGWLVHHWTLGFCALSSGDHADAHRYLSVLVDGHRTGGVTEPGAMRFVPDDIEALTNLGMTREAEALLDWYSSRADETGRVSAMAAAARCRGMLQAAAGEIDAAVACLESAATQQMGLGMPFEHGRTQLILGTTLRRGLRRAAARRALEQARATFTELGAAAWRDRTNLELERIGGRAPATDALTPSEQRVAQLVAEGLSNREVAAAAFVTVKTVEVTLTRVYRKLGLRSRTELVRSLSGQSPRTDRRL